MTEPNDSATPTPLSRMRFSWQRGAAPPEGEHTGAAPGAVPSAEPATPPAEPPPTPPPPPPPPPATRLGRAGDQGGAPRPAESFDSKELDIPLRLDEESRPRRKRPSRPAPAPEPTSTAQPHQRRGRTTAKADFDVPRPGGRFSGGRGSHAGIRTILIVTACLLVLGIVGYSAYIFGVTTVRGDTYELSQRDQERFRITEFPLEQAGRFAADYARLCMTHSANVRRDGPRQAQLTKYVAEGVDPTCGWAGEGSQEVRDAAWTGSSEPITLDGLDGHARVMSVRVLTSTGSRILTVPVYVQDLRTGQGMRIIGDVGEMPQPLLVSPPKPEPLGEVDQELSSALVEGEFFRQYFEAWGNSDRPSVGRFVTPDASGRATAGLGGTLTKPQVTKAEVFLPKQATNDTEFRWKQGDVAEAWVWVRWEHPAAGGSVTQTRAYRLQLVRTSGASNPSQSWAVRDIRGGVPDVAME